MQTKDLERAVLLGLLFLLGAIAIVIAVPAANQYEISVYTAYPIYFWGLVVGALLTGLLVIVGSAHTPEDRTWVFGLLLVLLTNALLVLLQFIRGYQMYGRSDAMSHLGFVRDIGLSSAIGGGNIYPPMHLLLLALEDATGLDPMLIGMTIPVVFTGIYFGTMFYLLCSLFDSRVKILFALPFVLLPVLGRAHVGLRPYDVGLLLIPFVFYLFIKGQRNPVPSNRIAFVVVLGAFLLYHPLTALFLLLVFSLYFVARYVPKSTDQYATPTNLLSLSAVIFLVWYTNFTSMLFRFERVYGTLFGDEGGTTPADRYSETAEATAIELIDLLRVFSLRYGTEAILFTLGFAFVVAILLLAFREEYIPDRFALMLGGTAILFGTGGLLFLVADLIVPHDRPFQIAKIAAVIIVGQLFYFLIYHVNLTRQSHRARSGVYAILVVVLLLLTVLSVLTLYPSPLHSESNSQVTEMEIEGTQWLTEHGNTEYGLSEFHISYFRFYHAQFGTDAPMPFSGGEPPPSFNYTNHEYVGEGLDEDSYLTITRKGRIVYPEAFPDYPENWRFAPADFDRLDRDRTTVRIYDNGDYTQYLIDGTTA